MCGIAGSPQDRIALCIKDLLPCPDRADPRLQGHRMPAQASGVGRVVVGHFEFPELADRRPTASGTTEAIAAVGTLSDDVWDLGDPGGNQVT
jgi:hypothetical protein